MNSLLGQILEMEFKKSACLDRIAPLAEKGGPFPLLNRFGWFKMFLKTALKKVPFDSPKWPGIAAIYTEISGRKNFSNVVLGMLSLDEIHTFASVLNVNTHNEDFLLEDLEHICPVDLWIQLVATGIESVPLWKVILRQYKTYEEITGNLFLSLTTKDAVVYYIQKNHANDPDTEQFKGPNSDNPFVLATYDFRKLVTTE
jgi:hypothetical protein